MTKELDLRDNCKALVYNYEEADQQEKAMIADFANAIAHHLALSHCPAFVLDFNEYNGRIMSTTLELKIAKMSEEGVCILGIAPKMLFETTFQQEYHAENHDNSSENYHGAISGSIVMEGVLDEEAKEGEEHYLCPEFAEVALEMICGIYYRKILSHYPEWTTRYVDAPVSTTDIIEHV